MPSSRFISFFVIFMVLAVIFGRDPLKKDLAKINDPMGYQIDQAFNPKHKGIGGLFGSKGATVPGVGGMIGAGTPQPQYNTTMPAKPLKPVRPPGYYLKDGRRVAFMGYRVFVIAKDDKRRFPLPDGDYTLEGDYKFSIRNGRRQPGDEASVAPDAPKKSAPANPFASPEIPDEK